MGGLEIKRRMAPDDIADVQELLRAAERSDGHRPLSDHLWLDLVEGGRPGFAGLIAWEAGHEHPVGYAQVSRGNESWALEVVVHPHHRYDMSTIGPQLVHTAVEVVAGEGGGHLHWWVFEPTTAHARLAAQVGLSPGRTLLQMRRPLPLGMETTIVTRAFVPGRDEDAWLAVNNRAFASHPEQGGWARATLEARQREPWFDAGGFLLHERDGELAGFCWTKIHADLEPPQGEIYVIAADPRQHGHGLGRALTVAGLNHLADAGIGIGMLYVDADNAPATSLYSSLGFSIHRTDRAFVGDIAAATR